MTANLQSWLASYTRRSISRRKFLGTTAAGAGAAALIACGGSDGGGGSSVSFSTNDALKPGSVWLGANDWKLPDETKDAVRGGIYRNYIEEDEQQSYDALILAPSQSAFSGHVHEYLMAKNRGPGIDPSSPESDVPVPALAQNFEVSNDGLTVTFTMRPNVKFHPVAPVNSRVMDMDDWKTTLERFLATSAQREPITSVLDRAEYPDATHMVWRLKFPYKPLLTRIHNERFAFQIIPKEINMDSSLHGTVAAGTGYKILDKHQPSVTMEYRKHAEYWGGDPFIDRWHYPVIPEYANRYSQFVTGNMVEFAPSARDILTLMQDAPGAVVVANALVNDQLARVIFGRINATTQPWKDPRVRIAIRRAGNFRGIGEFRANKQQFEAAGVPVEVVSRTHATYGLTYFLDPEKGELGDLSANYLHDIAEAKKLTAAAGFPDAIDIGFRTYPVAGEVPEQDALIIDSLNQSGVFNVNVENSTNTVEHRNCRSLRQCDGLVTSSINEDMDYAMREYHSEGPRPGGEPAFGDPELDRIADAYRRELDPLKSIAILHEHQKAAARFFPTVPREHEYTIFQIRWPWLHNTNQGYNGVALDGRPIIGGNKQWLDADMPRRNG
ncbi:MAG: twin-arginine translocation signal domain-containing protein [Dehalococcoidia bacterium]|nr:twin-arginine translocation signal domain-containing protein [Dehalococcoidia bacterium]